MQAPSKEVKIALTAIVATVLLIVGINFLKGVNVFKSSNSYYVRFTDVAGLVVSTPVYANGYPVGIVREVQYDYGRTDRVVVRIELDKNMHVPAGTRAELATELMGGVKMALVLGANPTALLSPGDTLSGGMHQGAMSQLEGMIPTLVALMPKLDSIMTNLNALTASPALQQTLQNTAALTANLSETSRTLNAVAQHDLQPLAQGLGRSADNVEKITGQLAAADLAGTVGQAKATLESAGRLTQSLESSATLLEGKLSSRDNTLGLLLNDSAAYQNLNSTLSHADSLMIDLKAHPKRYVHFSVFGKKDK